MSFLLEYPATGAVTHSVTLRDPEFGNVQSRDTSMSIQRTRLLDLSVLKDEHWPVINNHDYAFIAIDDTDLADLEDFIDNSKGESIKITDHESVERTGILLTAEVTIVTVSDECYRHNFAINFQQEIDNLFYYMDEGLVDYFVLEDGSTAMVMESYK